MNSDKKVIDRTNKIMKRYGVPFINESQQNTKTLDEDTRRDVTDFLTTFVTAMVIARVHPISQLTEKDILITVRVLDTFLSTDEETNELFNEIMQVGSLFLWWLAINDDSKLTTQQIMNTFEKINDPSQSLFAMFGGGDDNLDDLDAEDPDRDAYNYDRSDLPKYRDDTAANLRLTALDLAEKMVESGRLKPIIGKISDAFEDDMIYNLADVVSHLYGEYRLTPSRWTKKALKGVLTGFVIKDAAIRPKEYPQFGDILKAFMDVAAQNGFVSKRVADRMKRAIDEAEPEMIQLGAHKRNFSKGKRKLMTIYNPDHSIKDLDSQFSDSSAGQFFDDMAADDSMSAPKPGSEGRVISLSKWKKQNKKKKKRKPKKR